MVTALGVELTPAEFEQFWTASDRDNSGRIDGDEAVVFLRCLLCQSADTANRVLLFLTGGLDALRDSLMEPVDHRRSQANIEILDRAKGIIVKENIPIYIKVALKSMFSSQLGRLLSTGKKSVNLMTKLSIKQGVKYDDPKSKDDIPAFVALHQLNLNEVEKPLDQYATFNEFFARSLKPSARPIAAPDDPTVAVSPADCRLMVFEDIKEATELWIKGDKFTVEGVLGEHCADLASRYTSGSMVIARLAPQDYHRWHLPVNATLGRKVPIPGALYTVNPIAINQNVNVYTTNKRVVCELNSPEFGKVILVAVGATMVGSIVFLYEDGKHNKGEPHGYFAFGGSTVLLFFEPGRIKFDADLVANSRKKLETLVKVNERLGTALVAPDYQALAAEAENGEKRLLQRIETSRKPESLITGPHVVYDQAHGAVATPSSANAN